MKKSETPKTREEEWKRFEQNVERIATELPTLLKRMTPDQLLRIRAILDHAAGAIADEGCGRRKSESETPPEVERLWAELDRELDEEAERS